MDQGSARVNNIDPDFGNNRWNVFLHFFYDGLGGNGSSESGSAIEAHIPFDSSPQAANDAVKAAAISWIDTATTGAVVPAPEHVHIFGLIGC